MALTAIRIRTSSGWQDIAVQGPQGIQGPQGVKGDPGATGATGQAEAWYSSSGAPAGATGAVGDWHLDTSSGDVREKTAASTWTVRGNIRGPAGSTGNPGTPGALWRSGTGAPAGALGVVGDWYLNDANGDVYEKTGASAWTLRDNLTGPQGAQGPAGSGAADATTTSKGSVQLAGDLAGTAASPQIAAGAIVNADVNASAAIAEAKLALATDAAANVGSRRTLGTGALQAAAGNDARFTAIQGRAHTVYEVYGTGQLGPLGGAWQQVPGLTKTIALTAGDVVLMDASIYLVQNQPQAFFIVDGVLVKYQNATTFGALTSGQGHVAPLHAYYVSPDTANHTFAVYCTDEAGGGIGYAGSTLGTHMRLTVLGGLPGPKGDAGATSPPSGAAGGELRGTYPNPTLKPREGAGRVVGTSAQWEGPFSGVADFYSREPAVTYFNLSVTPSVNSWWPVDGQALVRTQDGAWYVINVNLTLTPADALGWSEAVAVVLHNVGAGGHVTANPRGMWALNAGVAYQCRLRTSYQSGGSWFWFDGGSQHTYIQSPGVMPR